MMKDKVINAWNSFLKLLRFLAWYGIAVAAMFYLLPMAGLFVEGHYDAMSGAAKLVALIGFFAVVTIWQILAIRDRMRAPLTQTARR